MWQRPVLTLSVSDLRQSQRKELIERVGGLLLRSRWPVPSQKELTMELTKSRFHALYLGLLLVFA